MKNRRGSQQRDRNESTGKLMHLSVVKREKLVSLPRTWKTSCAELGLSHHLWGVPIMSRQGRRGEVWMKIEGKMGTGNSENWRNSTWELCIWMTCSPRQHCLPLIDRPSYRRSGSSEWQMLVIQWEIFALIQSVIFLWKKKGFQLALMVLKCRLKKMFCLLFMTKRSPIWVIQFWVIVILISFVWLFL